MARESPDEELATDGGCFRQGKSAPQSSKEELSLTILIVRLFKRGGEEGIGKIRSPLVNPELPPAQKVKEGHDNPFFTITPTHGSASLRIIWG